MRRALLLVLCLCLLAGAQPVVAAPEVRGVRRSEPITIKSDELLTDSNTRTATFSGKVVARQGDITIYADRLIVVYAAKEQEVEKVEALGNVRIVQGTRTAQGGRATYDNRAGTITLEQNPKVQQGNDVVSGKVITYFVDEERSVVTSGPGERVEATITPREKVKEPGGRR